MLSGKRKKMNCKLEKTTCYSSAFHHMCSIVLNYNFKPLFYNFMSPRRLVPVI